MYLGIDPGTQCGWAVLDGRGRLIASGTWNLASHRHEGGGMRFLRLRRYLGQTLSPERPKAVFYEEVHRHLGTDAAHVYGGIVATIQQWCEECRVPYQGIPVGTVKKLATGKGNAGKAQMVEAANARWGRPVADDNEADARFVALAGVEGA